MAEEVANVAGSSHNEAGGVERRWTLKGWHKWLLIVGLIIRCAFALSVDKESSFGGWDGKEYYAYSQSLIAGKWDDYPRFFDGIRPPFYPIFLIPFLAMSDQAVWPIQLAQSFLGILQAIILAKIAGRWAGERAGNFALFFALFHPFLIYYSAFVLTETLFITLLWFGIASLQRLEKPLRNQTLWIVAAAVALGLACLTRPTLQLFLPVAAVWLGWRTWRLADWKTALRRTALFTTMVSALLLPWMVRNARVHGEITLAPGITYLNYSFSNSPEYLRMYQAKTKDEYYEIFSGVVTRMSVESASSQKAWRRAVDDFRENHAGEWWKLQAYKFKHFWTPWLNPLIFSRTNVLISLVTVTPLFLLGLAELFQRFRSPDAFLLLLVGLLVVGYLVGGLLFHVQVRYRFPYVDVTLLIFTASFLGRLQLISFAESKLMRFLRPPRFSKVIQ